MRRDQKSQDGRRGGERRWKGWGDWLYISFRDRLHLCYEREPVVWSGLVLVSVLRSGWTGRVASHAFLFSLTLLFRR